MFIKDLKNYKNKPASTKVMAGREATLKDWIYNFCLSF